jgi:hypothetical protein
VILIRNIWNESYLYLWNSELSYRSTFKFILIIEFASKLCLTALFSLCSDRLLGYKVLRLQCEGITISGSVTSSIPKAWRGAWGGSSEAIQTYEWVSLQQCHLFLWDLFSLLMLVSIFIWNLTVFQSSRFKISTWEFIE